MRSNNFLVVGYFFIDFQREIFGGFTYFIKHTHFPTVARPPTLLLKKRKGKYYLHISKYFSCFFSPVYSAGTDLLSVTVMPFDAPVANRRERSQSSNLQIFKSSNSGLNLQILEFSNPQIYEYLTQH
jgi:hypothetical protein